MSSVVKSVRWHLVTKVPSHVRFLLAPSFRFCDAIHVGRPTAVFPCPLIAVGLLYLEVLWSSVPLTIARKMVFTAIHPHPVDVLTFMSAPNFANAARILPIPFLTHYGSIFYPQVLRAQYFARTFAFRPLYFQYFTSRGGGGGGRAPIEAFHAQHSAIGARHWLACHVPLAYDCNHPPTVLKGLHP